MTAKRSPTKVDPELTTQLDAADPDDAPVQAVVYLRSGSKGGPAAVSKRADQVIASATTKAGTEPSRVNVMRYLGTVAIEAPASFVRALLAEDDIESALANVHPGDDDPGLGRPSKTSAGSPAPEASAPEASASEASASEPPAESATTASATTEPPAGSATTASATTDPPAGASKRTSSARKSSTR
jgi:hypothetical protein